MQYKRIIKILSDKNILRYSIVKHNIKFNYNGINYKINYDPITKYYFIYNDSFYHGKTYLKYHDLKEILIKI